MALNLKMANAAVNAEADALSDQLDNGFLRIYDGSQPATADTAIGAQVLLAELLQPAHGLRFQPAIGQFLDAVGQSAFQVSAVEDWRLGIKQVAPLLFQLGHGSRLQRQQPCRDRIVLRHRHAILRCVGVA